MVSDDVRSETTEPCFGLGIGAAGGEQRRVYMKNGIGDNSSTETTKCARPASEEGGSSKSEIPPVDHLLVFHCVEAGVSECFWCM